jgi:hypothetical protein
MCHCHTQSCSCGSCACQSKGCSCSCHHSHCPYCHKAADCGCHHGHGKTCGCKHCEHHRYAERFLELADQAWMELLKEKIKEQIQSQSQNMDELARLIAEANREHWHKKMEDKQCCGSYEENLKNFFEQACRTRQGQKGSQQGGPSNQKQ